MMNSRLCILAIVLLLPLIQAAGMDADGDGEISHKEFMAYDAVCFWFLDPLCRRIVRFLALIRRHAHRIVGNDSNCLQSADSAPVDKEAAAREMAEELEAKRQAAAAELKEEQEAAAALAEAKAAVQVAIKAGKPIELDKVNVVALLDGNANLIMKVVTPIAAS